MAVKTLESRVETLESSMTTLHDKIDSLVTAVAGQETRAAALSHDVKNLRGEVGELRGEVKNLRKETRDEFAAVRREMSEGQSSLGAEMQRWGEATRAQFSEVHDRFDQFSVEVRRHIDVMGEELFAKLKLLYEGGL